MRSKSILVARRLRFVQSVNSYFLLFTNSIFYLLPCLLFFVRAAHGSPALKVYPGALGFGTNSVAGSGRHLEVPYSNVFRVINLEDEGFGSLRDCVEASGPRTCVFETSGEIRLKSTLKISEPYLTVAGQTAPEPGIMLTGSGVLINTHDVLIRHLQIRPGDELSGPKPDVRDGITIEGNIRSDGSYGSYDIVLDHLSVSWALDENISTFGTGIRDITISNCIFSEGLYSSLHPKGPHSMGILVGDDTKNISFRNNLIAHHNDRNPYLKPGVSAEFVNNVVYNWGGGKSGSNLVNVSDFANSGKPVLLNFIGNIYKPGPNSPFHPLIFAKPAVTHTRVFVAHNIGPTRMQDSGSDWLISGIPENPYRSQSPVFELSGDQTLRPEVAFESVLNSSGSRPRYRNPIDSRIIKEVRDSGGGIKDCVVGCARHAGGWPKVEIKRHILELPEAMHSDDDNNGYTNLEDWLQLLAEKREV